MNTRTTPPGVTPKASRWLMPLILVVLGAVVLVAEASQDDIGSGLAWFAVMAGSAAILAFGGRFEPVRLSRGDTEDERDALISTRAMAAAGIVWVVALTACTLFEVFRGENPSPYTQLLALGGGTYAAALLYLRWRS